MILLRKLKHRIISPNKKKVSTRSQAFNPQFSVVELNEKIKAWDAEQGERDKLNSDIEAKKDQLTKLNEEIQKKRQELSEPQIKKLDYFEGEVRRLE